MKPASLLPLLVFATACATAPRVPQAPEDGDPAWDRLVVDAIALPMVWTELDQEDRLQPGNRIDTATGPGLALRAGLGDGEQSLGLFYLGSALEEDDSGTEFDLHALCLDFDVRAPWLDEIPGLFVHAGAGFGFGTLQHETARFEDVSTGAANLRLDLEFAPRPGFSLLFGMGGFVLGWPGETEAYGTFAELGLRFTF